MPFALSIIFSAFLMITSSEGTTIFSPFSYLAFAKFSSLSFHWPCMTSHSLVCPRIFLSRAFSYIMKPGFGAAIDLTFQHISRPSLSEIFLILIKYPSVKVVARDLPAKQCTSTLWTGGSPSLFALKASHINLLAWSTYYKTFWFGESRQGSYSYMIWSGNLALIPAAVVKICVIPNFYRLSRLYAAPTLPMNSSGKTAPGVQSSLVSFMAVSAFITWYT